jgi:hypothetical protein
MESMKQRKKDLIREELVYTGKRKRNKIKVVA